MDPSDVKQLEKLFAVPFVDSYGMTETGGGVFSTLPGLSSPTESTGVAISFGLEVKVSLIALKINIIVLLELCNANGIPFHTNSCINCRFVLKRAWRSLMAKAARSALGAPV